MNHKYQHLNVAFESASAERLLAALRKDEIKQDFSFGVFHFSETDYRRFGNGLRSYENYTEDEIRQRSSVFTQWLDSYRNDSTIGRGTIFDVLAQYGRETFLMKDEILCRPERFLDWREYSLKLGQDLFTCCWLANEDIANTPADGIPRLSNRRFDWPANIRTDDPALKDILKSGISENHFHLNGSIQVFPIAWAFLMNHPDEVTAYFENGYFKAMEDLKGHLSFGVGDNHLSWQERIWLASWIRATLFQCLNGNREQTALKSDFLLFEMLPSKQNEVKEQIRSLRFNAERWEYPENKRVCMDYTITPQLAETSNGACRLLAGERSFLYQCFFYCFRRDGAGFDEYTQNLFYLYLLLKLRFREELIQVNNRKGFRNFSDYQNRKSVQWGNRTEYWYEAYRLAVASGFEPYPGDERNPFLRSIELRIMPVPSAEDLKVEIENSDELIENGMPTWPGQDKKPYFYTLHFGKKPLEPISYCGNRQYMCKVGNGKKQWIDDDAIDEPRNAKERRAAEIQAKAIGKALGKDHRLYSRIRGIDACSHEIGCRPETFATAFRYLRSLQERPNRYILNDTVEVPRLGVTYHAGEDFLDLVDGIRAIDEAVCFLNMQSGDRIGHALALGTAPEKYYRIKNRLICLPKQDLLDNLIWLLFRSQDWCVPCPPELSRILSEQVAALLREIYGDGYYDKIETDGNRSSWLPITPQAYYKSWRLRGDDPQISSYFKKAETVERFTNYLDDVFQGMDSHHLYHPYEKAKLDKRLWEYSEGVCEANATQVKESRKDRLAELLLYHYHFNVRVRMEGQKVVFFEITDDYLRFVRTMQDALMKNLCRYKISIECNPSSNKLIGTFDKYEEHPIFRFNHFGLSLREFPDQDVQLNVSVNTDDQGVFDTSLETEYTVVQQCLVNYKDEKGHPQADTVSANEYIDHLRKMGNRMSFQ